MAYRRRTRRLSSRRGYARRSTGYSSRRVRPSRRRRASGSASRTVRIVIEQPGSTVARPLSLLGQMDAKAPKKAKF